MKADKEKELFIELRSPGKGAAKTFPSAEGLTLGTDYGCDMTVEHPGLPRSYGFVKKRGKKGHALKLPAFARGVLKKGTSTLPIHTLMEMDRLEKSGGFYLVDVRPGDTGEILLGEASIRFGYRQKPPAAPRLPFIPFLSGGDYLFLLTLVLSVTLHMAFVSYLNSLEIIKRSPFEAIKTMEPRFAKLILRPREPLKEKLTPLTVKKEEEVEEKSAEKKPVEKKAVKKKKGMVETAVSKKKGPAVSEKPPDLKTLQAERKGRITKKVKTKGLLGVIGAKGGVLAGLKTDEVLSDVESIIANANGIETEVVDDLAELGTMEVATVSRGLPEVGNIIEEARGEEELLKEKTELASFQKKEKKRIEEIKTLRNEADVYRVVKSYVGGLKYLYNNALRKDPTLKGTITVRLVIVADGSFSNLEMLSSTLGHPPLEKAILKRIGLWKFKKIAGAKNFTITYTFDFAPVG